VKFVTMQDMCDNCPWRPEADCRTIPGYSMEMAENLVTGTRGFVEDVMKGRAHIMQCHKTTDAAKPSMCAGFALNQARNGMPNIMLRMMISQFGLDIIPKDYGQEIHSSIEEMVEKHRAQLEKDE
jgi:hypothetical protein